MPDRDTIVVTLELPRDLWNWLTEVRERSGYHAGGRDM